MSTVRHYMVNVVAQTLSRVFSMGAGFLIFVLIARTMGAEALGEFAMVMAFILIAGNIADMGTMGALAKDLVLEKEQGLDDVYFANYLVLRLILAVLAILIAVPLLLFIKPELQNAILISSLAVPFVGSRFLETVYQVYERPQFTIFASIFLALIQLCIAIPLLFWLKVDLEGYLFGFVLTQALYFACSMYLALRLLKPRFDIQWQSIYAILLLAAPMGLFSLFNAFSSRLDIFMLSMLRSSEEMGHYNAAYRLLDLAIVVATTAAVPLVPVLSRLLKEKGEEARTVCRRILELTVIVLLPVPFCIYFLAEDVILFLYGQEYLVSVQVLQIFALLFVCFSSMYIASAINLAADNIHHSWWSAAIAALLNVVVNYSLIPGFGITGAAMATVVSTLFMMMVSLFYVNKSLQGAFELKRWAAIVAIAMSLFLLAYALQSSPVVLLVFALIAVHVLLIFAFRLHPRELLPAKSGNKT